MHRMRRFILPCAALLIIMLLFGIGPNSYWFHTRVWGNFVSNLKRLDAGTEDRKLLTLGDSYMAAKAFAIEAVGDNISKGLILIPPTTYLHARWGRELPEPVVLYYFTGIRTTLPNGKNAGNAMHAVLVTNKVLEIVPITSPGERTRILTLYQSYSR